VLVRFQDVGFLYAGRPEVLIGLNLSVESGEMIAIVGRSGAGKTTVLKLVNRLLLPTSGAVVVEGRDTREWDGIRLRRRIGYVFQDVGLFPHMTIEENIEVVPRLEQWPRERARARAHHLLGLVGLPPQTYASRRPHELSGGQRQRVGLARALAVDPPILLMDEPFGALDPVTRTEVRREFARIQEQLGTTVIIVTHDMAEAFILGRRIGVIDAGQLVICDTPTRVADSSDPRVRAFMDTLPRFPPAGQTERPPSGAPVTKRTAK
jgi:osmoprotectant transport system ATP-binding protein